MFTAMTSLVEQARRGWAGWRWDNGCGKKGVGDLPACDEVATRAHRAYRAARRSRAGVGAGGSGGDTNQTNARRELMRFSAVISIMGGKARTLLLSHQRLDERRWTADRGVAAATRSADSAGLGRGSATLSFWCCAVAPRCEVRGVGAGVSATYPGGGVSQRAAKAET